MPQPLVSFSVSFHAPLDLAASFAPLGRSGDDALDRWDGRRLMRALPLPDGRIAPFVARPSGSLADPRLVVEMAVGADMPAATNAITASVASPATALRALSRLAAADRAVAALVERYPGVRPVMFPDPFTALVRSISAQQVNLRWAAEIRRRLAVTFGQRHEVAGEAVYTLSPERIAGASPEELRGLQLTRAKSVSVIACARAAADDRLQRDELAAIDDEGLINRLTTLPGIGRWSAEWFLARTLGRARVVAGDLGVRKAVGRLYAGGAIVGEGEVRRLTAHWGDAASLVQALALHDLAEAEVARRASPGRLSRRSRAG
jgi:DNA-3-methyladenine glycosylase II